MGALVERAREERGDRGKRAHSVAATGSGLRREPRRVSLDAPPLAPRRIQAGPQMFGCAPGGPLKSQDVLKSAQRRPVVTPTSSQFQDFESPIGFMNIPRNREPTWSVLRNTKGPQGATDGPQRAHREPTRGPQGAYRMPTGGPYGISGQRPGRSLAAAPPCVRATPEQRQSR